MRGLKGEMFFFLNTAKVPQMCRKLTYPVDAISGMELETSLSLFPFSVQPIYFVSMGSSAM